MPFSIKFVSLWRQKKIKMENEQRYSPEDFQEALSVLRSGGVLLYPTDTIWGIGCDATNEQAVKRIYSIKHRAESKSMLVLLDAIGKLQGYVSDVPAIAYDLLDCATRPTTIIYPRARNLAPNLIAEDGSIGIRITTERFTRSLISALHHPIVSTSANLSGEPAPKFFHQISPDILAAVDYVVKYRQEDTTEHQPSSIIQLWDGGRFKIIR